MKECVDIPDFGLGEGWGEKWEKWGEWWQGERPEQREEWERWKRWKQWEQEWEQEWEKQRDEHPWRVIHPQYEENPLVAVGRTLLIDHHLEKSPPIAKRGTPDSFSSFYRLLLDPRNQYLESGVQDITNVGLNKEERQRFNLALRQALEGRCFFTTRSGYIGVGPRGTCPGHRVAILSGGNMPFIIKGEGPSLHSLIGEAYVHGIMDRELRIPWGKLHDIHLI
ncbi:hypothetical protein F4824DRAFT_443164 [Ustulina deusta]|nr:hypothetical protein F4824DRAFT_443164 [Ustulina deusta]